MFITFLSQYPFFTAFLLGLLPALVWMWFWLKEDRHPEPARMLTLAFLGGMIAVACVLPIQEFVYDFFATHPSIHHPDMWLALEFAIWASLEEIFIFLFVNFLVIRNKENDEPVDSIIYLIVGAIGFAVVENTLFLIDPIKTGDIVGILITSNMRFLGASLLHIMSSATIGIFLGLSYYKTRARKREYLAVGLILAIILHTSFNLFIINQVSGNIFVIFGMVWTGIIILLLLFEKVKSVKNLVI